MGTTTMITSRPSHATIRKWTELEQKPMKGVHQNPELYKTALAHPSFNRYSNVLAFEHSRVTNEENPSDYFNGNYIQMNSTTKYIATQAPLPSTFSAFWSTVWNHQVQVIVMLTKFFEGNRPKAECYWPEKNLETYGSIRVSFIKESSPTNSIRLREFLLRKGEQTRTVTHIQYTEWPDFGIPKTTYCFRVLLRLVDQYQYSEKVNPKVPVMVHCSAGIGRAGTFLAISMIKQKIQDGTPPSDIDIQQIISDLREQRYGLVQTIDQYEFIRTYLQEQNEPQPRRMSPYSRKFYSSR